MPHSFSSVPVVLSISANDPTGGAGIQADIEAIASMGCHCAPVISAIAVQDTHTIKACYPLSPSLIIEQARSILEDVSVAAIKVGLLATAENVAAVQSVLADYAELPVVFDPVIASASNASGATDELLVAIKTLLLPLVDVMTPTTREVRMLAPEADTSEACAQVLMDLGCQFILLSGSEEPTPAVVNYLYGGRRHLDSFSWERLPETFHGAGATLSASLAALLAQGVEPYVAMQEAQEYTMNSLKNAQRVGMGNPLPNRLFWAENE